MQKNAKLIWLDLEMTGLDIDSCHIIEVGVVITDKELKIIAEFPPIAIYQPSNIMSKMDKWCVNTHGNSGLTKRVENSRISVIQAEKIILNFLIKHVPVDSSPLCGNSIWQDRKFLTKYMPNLERFFHYRLLDVSSLNMAISFWTPDLLKTFNKRRSHLALEDVKESIKEFEFYRQLFNLPL